jgi:heat shock protein HtpX
MAIALAVAMLVYVGGIVLGAVLVVLAWRAGRPDAVLSGLVALALLAPAAGAHVRRVEGLALRAAHARILFDDEEQMLQAAVARLAAAADLPKPRVALIHSWAPNAFSIGLSPGRAVIAVTTELLRRLDARELEAVIAHELAHVANRDGAVMTFVGGPAIAGSALGRAKGLAATALFVLGLPVYGFGLLLMWTMSRYREYAADRGACLLVGAPEQLESALVKIAGRTSRGDLRGGAAISAVCIVSAHPKKRFELFMDHPPLEKRLRRLERIARELGKPAL